MCFLQEMRFESGQLLYPLVISLDAWVPDEGESY
jgi:hypothetical protein